MQKPRVFIGSSSEGLTVAESVFAALQPATDPTLWSHQLFRPGQYPMDELERQLGRHSFAVLVATPDDQVFRRGDVAAAMRDNILVEFGMFAGRIGRRRTFLVCPDTPPLALPSDLAGMVQATYDAKRAARGPDDRSAAVQIACQQIRDLMAEEWRHIQDARQTEADRLRASHVGQALQRLNSVVVKLRDAIAELQRDGFSAFSDEQRFDDLKATTAGNVESITKGFEGDAQAAGVADQLQELSQVTREAVLDLPFPEELSVDRGAATESLIGGLSDYLRGNDPMKEISREAGDRLNALKTRYATWWDGHAGPIGDATSGMQDALFEAMTGLALTQADLSGEDA